MSLLRKYLFTDDSPKLVLDLDKKAFGASYGNRRASRKQFGESWKRESRGTASASHASNDASDLAGCG
jgi:hypothetical protein